MNKNTFHFDKACSIWIYGYGFLGRPLFERMLQAGYTMKGFIDNNADSLRRQCLYPVIRPDELEYVDSNDVIILSFQNIKEQEKVAHTLSSKDHTHLIYLYRDTELYPWTFDLYNSLVYGNFSGEFDFPVTSPYTKKKSVYHREYDQFVVIDMPVQLLFSAALQPPIELGYSYVGRDWCYPIVSIYEYNAFFKMVLYGIYEQLYLERYIQRLQRGRSQEAFLRNRIELCDMLAREFREGGLSFFRNAPSHVVFDTKRGWFCLQDGHHRACFLVNQGQNCIPIRITKQEYTDWLNNAVVDTLALYFANQSIIQVYTPILHPSFLDLETVTENIGQLNASVIYSYFAKRDISDCKVIDLDANLSYYSRIFTRIGAKSVVSVEKRTELREAARLINVLEHCETIIVSESIPNEAGDILLWLNDVVPCFEELDKEDMQREIFCFLNKLCKQYLLIKTSNAEKTVQLIKENTYFKMCTLLNCVLENGIKKEVLLFERIQ